MKAKLLFVTVLLFALSACSLLQTREQLAAKYGFIYEIPSSETSTAQYGYPAKVFGNADNSGTVYLYNDGSFGYIGSLPLPTGLISDLWGNTVANWLLEHQLPTSGIVDGHLIEVSQTNGTSPDTEVTISVGTQESPAVH